MPTTRGRVEECNAAVREAHNNVNTLSQTMSIRRRKNQENSRYADIITRNSELAPVYEDETSTHLPEGRHGQQNGDADSDDDAVQLFAFELGTHYPLIQGILYFSWHPDEAYTAKAIKNNKRLFYFSSIFPGVHC